MVGTIVYLNQEVFTVDGPPWGSPSNIIGDVIEEICVETGELLWEWRLKDHVNPNEHNGIDLWGPMVLSDWSHGNTVNFHENYAYGSDRHDVILFNARHLDTFYMIDHPSGEILWSCGQNGQFGRREPPEEPLFNGSHAVNMIAWNRFILFDNGNMRNPPVSRAVEVDIEPISGIVTELWSWTDPNKEMFNRWGGDVKRLPNGNRLLTDVTAGRVIEVTLEGQMVWDMTITMKGTDHYHHVYMCERVPALGSPPG